MQTSHLYFDTFTLFNDIISLIRNDLLHATESVGYESTKNQRGKQLNLLQNESKKYLCRVITGDLNWPTGVFWTKKSIVCAVVLGCRKLVIRKIFIPNRTKQMNPYQTALWELLVY